MTGELVHFDSKESFYADDERRRLSGEVDFGVYWRWFDGAEFPTWRVSYIRTTGEVYAIENRSRQVVLMGAVPPDDPEDGGDQRYYRTLDGLLEGWADACGRGETLGWILERLYGSMRYSVTLKGD